MPMSLAVLSKLQQQTRYRASCPAVQTAAVGKLEDGEQFGVGVEGRIDRSLWAVVVLKR